MTTFPQINLDEFRAVVVKFRERMGRASLGDEQRRAIFRALTLSYFATDDGTGRAADLFLATAQEYAARMRMMGVET